MVLKDPVSSSDHVQGPENAPLTLIEYGDYQCPYCGQAYKIVKALQKHYGNQLRYVFRNFPLTQVHQFAEAAAETAEFASDQGVFWEMHDLIYENQDQLSIQLLLDLAESLELSKKDLQTGLEKHAYLDRIKKDFMSGVRSGVNGTPTFFINGYRFNGAPIFQELVDALDYSLAKR